MSNQPTASTGQLPSYITSATPLGADKRAAWSKNVAPTYAGIFLWFVFWQNAAVDPAPGGTLAQGVGWALVSLLLAALVCHFLFYLVPGLLGQKTGLPLYIVGTSTFGAQGGFLMPGFLMGILQFGWLGVNIYFSSAAVGGFFDAKINPMDPSTIPMWVKMVMVVWGVLAALVGLKGIQYVAKVSTYLPLIPLAVLAVLFVKTIGSVGDFKPSVMTSPEVVASLSAKGSPLGTFGVLAAMMAYVVGFFATAGAAGVDIAMSTRNSKDVSMGGLVGIALAILLTAGLALLIVAGVYGSPALTAAALKGKAGLNAFNMIPVVLGDDTAKWMKLGLAVAAFPPACFSSFIAANSFKTTLPQVNPFISVGIGAAVSIILAVVGWAGDAAGVFVVIGASFGPICGAMLVDYLLSNGNWSGPRAGFNPSGWISWAVGFVIGILPNLKVWFKLNSLPDVPAAPVAAFIVGAVLYFLCAKMGMLSPVVPIPEKK